MYFFRVFGYFEKSGVITKLKQKKEVFREPKKTSEMDVVLKNYSRAAKDSGSILFSVVGGKMSEGINFSDNLGELYESFERKRELVKYQSYSESNQGEVQVSHLKEPLNFE